MKLRTSANPSVKRSAERHQHRFDSGKTNLIIGQSGSGKTVLVKNLVGLLEPTSGDVLYDGRNFMAMDKKEKIMLRREMGMISRARRCSTR